MAPLVEKVVEPVTLGEGPHWDVDRQLLYFVSILDQTIHKYDPSTKTHTKTNLDGRVGFIIPVEGRPDEFVVGVERRVLVVRWSGEDGAPAHVVAQLAELDEHRATTRINDAKADPSGRLFAGTMGHENPPGQFERGQGSLYRVAADGVARAVVDGLGIANGLAWDVRRRAFYCIDSLDYCVRQYDYDLSTGDIANKKIIFDFKTNDLEGFPDGMTIDSDGNLWIANFNGSRVVQVDPASGALLQTVPVPALQVTSVAFGGANLDELYVTTASMDIGGEQKPPCGATFKVTGLGVKGLPMASVKL